MDRDQFARFVEETLAGLPRKYKKLLHNIAVMVEDQPPASRRGALSSLLGIYHGVPFQYRGPYYGNTPPDVIVIYQQPIESISSSDEDVRERIREVVFHEIGHYFGLSESDLRDIEK